MQDTSLKLFHLQLSHAHAQIGAVERDQRGVKEKM